MNTLKTKVHPGTWLDVPGVCTTFHLDKRPTGLRVCVMELEGQPTVARLIQGDGRTPNFVEHAAGLL